MTVKELGEKLMELPGDLEVYTPDSEAGDVPVVDAIVMAPGSIGFDSSVVPNDKAYVLIG